MRPPLPLAGRIDMRLRKRINRAPSPIVAYGLPWLTIAVASLLTGWLTIASYPVLPPLGFLMLLGWRQLRPGVLPVWAGLPLGLFDDCVSGQPPGSAVLQWSVAMLVLDSIEARWPWRNFLIEWLVAAVMIAASMLLSGLLASGLADGAWVPVILPQIAIAVLAYPLGARAVAMFDRIRLLPFRVVR